MPSAKKQEQQAEVASRAVVLHFVYSLAGLVLGAGCMLGGIFLSVSGYALGDADWTAKVLGLESEISDAGAGVILFVVGLFIIRVTKFDIKAIGSILVVCLVANTMAIYQLKNFVDDFEYYLEREYRHKSEREYRHIDEFRSDNLAIRREYREHILDIYFEVGSAQLSRDSLARLDRLSADLRDLPRFDIEIVGHADPSTPDPNRFASNLELGAARAISAFEYLISLGIEPRRMSAVTYGEYRPGFPNDTEEGRQRNRRVDIFLVDPERSVRR